MAPSSSVAPTARRTVVRRVGVGRLFVVVALRSATANAETSEKRSAGIRSSALSSAASTATGTAERTGRTGRAASDRRRAMIAWAVGPVNGGSPANISYRTQARLY